MQNIPMQLIIKFPCIPLYATASYYGTAFNSGSGVVEFPEEPISTTQPKTRSREVESSSAPKPYSLTDDSLECLRAVHDIYEVKWNAGKGGGSRIR